MLQLVRLRHIPLVMIVLFEIDEGVEYFLSPFLISTGFEFLKKLLSVCSVDLCLLLRFGWFRFSGLLRRLLRRLWLSDLSIAYGLDWLKWPQ